MSLVGRLNSTITKNLHLRPPQDKQLNHLIYFNNTS